MISRKLSNRWGLIFPALLFDLPLVAQTTADCGYTPGQSFFMCADGVGRLSAVCVTTSNMEHFCVTSSSMCKCSDGTWQNVGTAPSRPACKRSCVHRWNGFRPNYRHRLG